METIKQLSEKDYTKPDEIIDKMNLLRKGFNSQKTKNLDFRLKQLNILRDNIIKYEKEIHLSNLLDLGQKEFTSLYGTYLICKNDIDFTINNFKDWSSPRNVETPVLLSPGSSWIQPEPFGICVVFSSWNFQYLTLIMPIATAIAAGNCILAKPSEMAPASASICEKIFENMDPEIIQVVQGGADQCIALNKIKSDFIVFTGSPLKGKIIARAAAEFLTPCMLELGGQNPVIVDKNANLENAAYNICNGRFFNSGQTCLSPEYVLYDKSIQENFKSELIATVKKFFGDAKSSDDYSLIINDWHSDRLQKLIANHKGKLLYQGGECNIKNKFIPPTIIEFESIEEMQKSPLVEGEIFGPILYIAPFNNFQDSINYINKNEKPLALYYFGNDSKNKNKITKETSSGALVFNDAVIHFTSHYLPFGGVGTSGYSAYHGKWGFENLSHLKPILDRPQFLLKSRYPPYTESGKGILKFALKNLNFTQSSLFKRLAFTVVLFVGFYYRNSIISKF